MGEWGSLGHPPPDTLAQICSVLIKRDPFLAVGSAQRAAAQLQPGVWKIMPVHCLCRASKWRGRKRSKYSSGIGSFKDAASAEIRVSCLSSLYGFLFFFIHHYYANVAAGNKCAFCETFVVTDWSIQKPWSWPHTGSKTFKQAPLSSDLWLKASAPTPWKERMEGYVLCELSASRWIGVAWNTPLAQNPRSKLMSFVITAPHSNYHSGQFMD